MKLLSLFVTILILSRVGASQDLTLRGQVTMVHRSKHKSGSSDVVLWLTPTLSPPAAVSMPVARLVQKDKRFAPHVIAVRVGTEIDFQIRICFSTMYSRSTVGSRLILDFMRVAPCVR
jgi:hypothetical protein